MTEINLKNREAYLDVCKKVWDLDDESMDYLSKRTSDEWKPVPEIEELTKIPGAVFEDQRIRFDIDMANPSVQSFFENDDYAYQMFRDTFARAIRQLRECYSCNIGYNEFITNKVIFKKNQTKIKKVLETIYAEFEDVFEGDSYQTYTKEDCSKWIVKKFERIGASKKSAKKLQFVISLNPMDWMLASTAEKFSSCFNLNNEGGGYQYCLGLPFIAGDKNRMMLYITDGSKKEFMGIKVDSVQTRTWCILDKSGSMNIVKWYPNDTVGVTPVVAITGQSRFKNRDSFSISKYPWDIISTKKGAVIGVYSDMGRMTVINDKLYTKGNGKDGQQVFTKNLIDVTSKSRCSFRFNELSEIRCLGVSRPGYRMNKWSQLGLHVDMMFPTLRCKKCGRDMAGFTLSGDNSFLCYDCYKDSIETCESCGNEFAKTSETKTVETTDGRIIKLCPACLERAKERICKCCGKYSTSSLLKTADFDENGNRILICKDCLESGRDGYAKCDKCGDITKNATIKFNTATNERTVTCESCSNGTDDTFENSFFFGRFFCYETAKMRSGDITLE